jgi:hypothetical protein
MKLREVRDDSNTTWSCVQAFAGSNGEASKLATKLVEEQHSEVEVVCTPSGGAQTVRLQLPGDWMETWGDQDLVAAIQKEKPR